MKSFFLIYQRNVALQGVIEKYPDVFGGKTEAEAAVQQFASNNQRSAELLSILGKPKTVLTAPKKDKARKLAVDTARKAGIGLLLATRQNDVPKAEMYKLYRRDSARKNYWALYQTAQQVAAELAKENSQAADAGLTAESLAAYQSQIAEFGIVIQSTLTELQQHKAARQELVNCLAENNFILRHQIDPFANLIQDTYADFYLDFKIARRNPLRRKAVGKEEEALTELSGTVTDSTTQLPVANATIDVSSLGLLTTTDEDGYYLFDEVPAGTFTLSCHAEGYQLPEAVPLTTDATEPLQVNFAMQPNTAQEAA